MLYKVVLTFKSGRTSSVTIKIKANWLQEYRVSYITHLSGLSGESSSLFSSITGIGTGFLGFFSADFKGFFFRLLSTEGAVSEVAAEPDTPLSRMISGTALKEGWSFLRSTVGISSSPVSEDSDSPSTSLVGSSSGVVSVNNY